MEMLLNWMPEPLAWVVLMTAGAAVSVAALRLGYRAWAADAAYRLVCWAEKAITGEKMGKQRKAVVVKKLRALTPDWIDPFITEALLDSVAQWAFARMKKSVETAMAAGTDQTGEDGHDRK